MTPNFQNLMKHMNLYIPEGQQTPRWLNSKRFHAETHHNQIVKTKKANKQKRKKWKTKIGSWKKLDMWLVIYKGSSVTLTANFYSESMEATRLLSDIFEVLKGKKLSKKILYPRKLLFKNECDIKTFPDKQKLREIIVCKPALEEC